MLLEKTLILKGVAGAAAVGGVVGGGYFLKKSLEKPLTKEEKLAEINKKLDTLGLGDCHFTENEITNVNEFSRECELDLTKLQKINFSNKGTDPVTVTGLNSGNIKLKIAENNSNVIYTFKDVKTKITISGATGSPDIILKPNVKKDFEDKNGKLTKVPASSSEAANTKEVNKKLSDLKIPDKCRFDEAEKDENSIECDLSNKEELKKIDFSNKVKGADSKIDDSTTGLKLTINRLSEEEKKLKHSPKIDLEFIFSGYSSEIKIMDNKVSGGLSDFVLKPNTNPIFTMTDESAGEGNENRLAKTLTAGVIANRLGLSCPGNSPYSCTPYKAGTSIKVLNSGGDGIDEIAVASGQDNDQIISATDDVDGYEQGVKFTVTKAFPTTNSKLTANDCYEAKYLTGKGWALSKKTTC